MKRFAVLLFALATSAVAQSASRDKILQLYDALQVKQGMQLMVNTVQEQIVPSAIQAEKARVGAALSDEDEEYLRGVLQRRVAENFGSKVLGQMLEAMIPVYQRYFSDTDIDNIIAFYQTPTGKKFISQQNDLLRDGMAAAQPIMITQMNRTMEEMEKEVGDYLKQKSPPQKQATPKSTSPQSKS